MRRREHTAGEVKQWNAEHPSGTAVLFWPGLKRGEGRATKTRSVAWDLCGSPVVLVEGYSGGIALSHVEVRA